MDQAIEGITQSLKATIIPEFVDKLSKQYIDIISEKFNIPKDELRNCTKPLINLLINSEFTTEKKLTPKLKIQVDINTSNVDDVSQMGREQLRSLCSQYGLPKKRSNDDNRKLIRDYQNKNGISSTQDPITPTPTDNDMPITTTSLPTTTPTEICGYEGCSDQDEASDADDELSKQRNLIIKHTSSGPQDDDLEEENYSESEEEEF